MSSRRGLAFETCLVLLLLACGGGTSPLAADGETGGGGGGGDGGGGGGEDGGGGGGGSCTTATLPDLRAPGHEVQAAPAGRRHVSAGRDRRRVARSTPTARQQPWATCASLARAPTPPSRSRRSRPMKATIGARLAVPRFAGDLVRSVRAVEGGVHHHAERADRDVRAEARPLTGHEQRARVTRGAHVITSRRVSRRS